MLYRRDLYLFRVSLWWGKLSTLTVTSSQQITARGVQCSSKWLALIVNTRDAGPRFEDCTANTTYTVPRVPQCLSPRPKWDPPPPLRKRMCPSPRNQRGGHTRLRVRGVGGGGRKSLLGKHLTPMCTHTSE